MKPHPRIRKTIKWGGAVVTVLLVVVWIGSGWLQLVWYHGLSTTGVSVGTVWSETWQPPRGDGRRTDGWTIGSREAPFYMRWWFDRRASSIYSDWFAPLWPLTLTSALITCAAWRLDTLARRAARLNLCPKCSYDRAGIAGDAKCPECGAMPA
jgi:hypothetical protein